MAALIKLFGFFVGVLLAAIFAPISLLTGRRAIHARGVIVRAEAHRVPGGERPLPTDLETLATSLAGPVMARLSPTADRGAGAHVLGLGLRFRRRMLVSAHPDHGDQDLLLATFDGFRPAQLVAARASTNLGDWLANEYRSVMGFRLGERRGVRLRAVGQASGAAGADAIARLEAALAGRHAVLRLDLHTDGHWWPLVEIRLCERVDGPPLSLHPANLRLDPRHAGLGLAPEGFLAAVRAVVYPAVQTARALRAR